MLYLSCVSLLRSHGCYLSLATLEALHVKQEAFIAYKTSTDLVTELCCRTFLVRSSNVWFLLLLADVTGNNDTETLNALFTTLTFLVSSPRALDTHSLCESLAPHCHP